MTRKTRIRLAAAIALSAASLLNAGLTFAPVLAADLPAASGTDMLAQSRPAGGRPPQEAIDACEGKEDGDSCSMTGREGTMSGTCHAPDAKLPAACMPAGRGPRG